MSGAQVEPTLVSRRFRAFRVAAFVALAGPLFGALIYLLVIMIASAGDGLGPGSIADALNALVKLTLMVVLFGYLIGGLPAIVAAAWLGWRTLDRGAFGYGEVALTAAVASCTFPVLMAITTDPSGLLGHYIVVGPVSVISALIGRFVLSRFGWI